MYFYMGSNVIYMQFYPTPSNEPKEIEKGREIEIQREERRARLFNHFLLEYLF